MNNERNNPRNETQTKEKAMKNIGTIEVEVFHVARHWNQNAGCFIPAYWSARAFDFDYPRICATSPRAALKALGGLLRGDGLTGKMKVVKADTATETWHSVRGLRYS